MFTFKHRLMETAGSDGAAGGGSGAAGGSAGAAGAGATPWYGGFDPDLKGYIETKGFPADEKGLSALATSYRNLERHFGVPAEQLLRLPKDETDKDGWGKIYERLGRPAKPEDYQLPVPEGDDGEYAKFISTAMHELGITKKQAQALAAKQNEFVGELTRREAAAYQEAIKTQDVALRAEWGPAYDKHIQIAKGAFGELGLKPEVVDAMEKAIGFAETMKFFYTIGSKIGEDKFVSADGSPGFAGAMSPAAAAARLEAIRTDPELSTKYINGDAAIRAEMDKLHKILAQSAA